MDRGMSKAVSQLVAAGGMTLSKPSLYPPTAHPSRQSPRRSPRRSPRGLDRPAVVGGAVRAAAAVPGGLVVGSSAAGCEGWEPKGGGAARRFPCHGTSRGDKGAGGEGGRAVNAWACRDRRCQVRLFGAQAALHAARR